MFHRVMRVCAPIEPSWQSPSAAVLCAVALVGCFGAAPDGPASSDARAVDAGGGRVDAAAEACRRLSVESSSPGPVYLDGRYTGKTTPAQLPVAAGARVGPLRVAVATDDGRYLERTTAGPSTSCRIALGDADRVDPITWKALFIGVRQVQAAGCELAFTQAELDSLFQFFQWSLTEHMRPATLGLHRWNVDREDVEVPIALTKPGGYYTIPPSALPPLSTVAPGDYDNVFVVWRGVGATCEIPAPYFGAAFGPDPSTRHTGYILVRTPLEDIRGLLDFLRMEDPGVFVHEWLHTSAENFYSILGAQLPPARGDDGVLHSGAGYGYGAPWISWYRDLAGARVDVDGTFMGIGPELLRGCTIRQRAVGDCG